MVDRAAAEFADIEKMVEAAEALSAPIAGAATTCWCCRRRSLSAGWRTRTLTFLTPTVIAGDRSLVSLVAHELAHSWSGNLVTNATWSDFWLNEGFTTYFENRIMEAVYGPERAAMLEVLAGAIWRRDRRARRLRRRTRILHLRSTAATPTTADSDRLREGRGLPATDRADGRPRAVRRLAAVLFRPARVHSR